MSCDDKTVCRLALARPGVEEGTSCALMAAEPQTYYITDHYAGYPWALIRLPTVHPDAVNDLLHVAHRLASAEKQRPRTKAARRRQ